MGFNIKQVTNLSENLKKEIGRDGLEYGIIESKNIIKMGYCCEPDGVKYPIYIKEPNKDFVEIRISQNGMYEIQQEKWLNVNDTTTKEQEEKIANIVIEKIKVPMNISFTLDYVELI